MKTATDLVELARQSTEEIPITELHKHLLNARALIDVREPEEFRAGHIEGAINIPRGLLEFKLPQLPGLDGRDAKLVIYCKTSGRAALACQSLRSMGYLEVYSVAGGIDGWISEGGKVVEPSSLDFG